ncbi:MAG: ATP-binding cassette domain-containing protein [Candidatus Thermoplasmatota archaeon]|nr:ATP-binding cassette domain-containing protein [Candidatus Thermoplasmatota archaeon]
MAHLEIEDLTVLRGTRTIIDNLSLKIEPGECVIITGENGSGKTTLIEAVAGILPLNGGSIQVKRPFGLTLQSGGINGDELVSERLDYASDVAGVECESEVLLHWDLEHRKSDRVGHLSGGLYRRLAVLQGLLPAYGQDERICILDEPSEGLDDKSVEILRKDISCLRERGNSFLIATHDSRLIECATTLVDTSAVEKKNTPLESTDDAPKLSIKTESAPIHKWSKKLDNRTLWPILSRCMPLVASILVLYALLGDDVGALVLVPTFLASLPPVSSLHHSKDSRSGDWWRAMGSRLLCLDPLSAMLIMISPMITATVLGASYDAMTIGLVGLPFVAIYMANGAIEELTVMMPRQNAQFLPLLSLILIWPLLIATDAIVSCSDRSLCSGDSLSLVVATIIPLIIWFSLPILHPRTGSH